MELTAQGVLKATIEGRVDPACRDCGAPNPEGLPVCGCGAPTPAPEFFTADVDHLDEAPLVTFWNRFSAWRRQHHS